MKVKSEVTESCPTLSNPMDCSLPGSSVCGIFQARVLEWGAIAFSDVGNSHGQILEGHDERHIDSWKAFEQRSAIVEVGV